MPRFSALQVELYNQRQAASKSKSNPASGQADEGPERDLHDKIMSEVERRGWLAFHSRMDKPTTVGAGVPDFVILLPKGKVLLVEAKSAKGKLSEAQVVLAFRANRLGHEVHVVRSFYDFYQLCQMA